MLRNRFSLDGTWEFFYDADSQYALSDIRDKSWQAVNVPAPWQSQVEGLEESTGAGWYRKAFTLDELVDDKTLILHFGAAYHYAQVWVNNQYLGDHDGGWLPFEFDIRHAIKQKDTNNIIVRVIVPNDNPEAYPDFPASEILHGKQSWYGSWGGLWQSVWLEQRAQIHIQQLGLYMDAENRVVTPTITLNQRRDNLRWQVDLLDMDGTTIQTAQFGDISDKIESENLHLNTSPKLWSPENPHLYTVRAQLFNNHTMIDEVTKTSGFRTIETRDGQVFLNGKPFYMRGALDQDYYPDTIATPPSIEFLKDQFQKAKNLGLNTIRYHIKVADPRYYQLADEIGLLLWVDLPNWSILTEKTKKRIRATLNGMIQRDGHHPSIAIWTIVNEDWGTDLVHNEAHRTWLREIYRWLKAKDPTRLIVDNSSCEPNFHIETDIADYHYYRSIPDHSESWDTLTQEIANNHSYAYSPNGDAHYTGQEPIIVSEFGNWGLPDVNNLSDENGKEAWWFETGHDWGEGIVYPHGIKHRFKQWHLDKIFGTFQHLTEAMQWQQFRALKYEIESLRSYLQIQGYVITELTDTHWENNGLMDMRRQPRIFASALALLNADNLAIAKPDKSVYSSGDKVQIHLILSCIGNEKELIAGVDWELGTDNGFVAIESITHNVNDLEAITSQQYVSESEIQTLKLYIRYKNGERELSNEYAIPIYTKTSMLPLKLAVDDETLRGIFAKLGYEITSNWSEADVVVVSQTNNALTDYVASGGKSLLIANHADALPQYESGYVIYQEFPFARIADRQSTIWNGDWVSSFSWSSSKHLLTASPLLDNQFLEITPDFVLNGFSQSDFPHDVGAGMFVGWIHRPVTILGYRRYHKGKIAVTTFNLQALDVCNPAQQLLVHDILEHLMESASSHQ